MATKFDESKITQLMSERGISRKSAVQFLRRQVGKPTADNQPVTEVPATEQEIACDAAEAVVESGGTIDDAADAAVAAVETERESQAVATKPATPVLLTAAPKKASKPATKAKPKKASKKASSKPAKKTAKKAAKKTSKPKGTGTRGRKPLVSGFNPEKCVKMYKEGTRIVDIAVAMGYERDHGQNRVRAVLIQAGVYKK